MTLPPLKQATGPVTWGVNFIFPPRGGVRRFTFPLGVVQGVIRRIGKFLHATETVVVLLLAVCVKFPRVTKSHVARLTFMFSPCSCCCFLVRDV